MRKAALVALAVALMAEIARRLRRVAPADDVLQLSPARSAPGPRTRKELYAEAQRIDLPGRSSMHKAELAAALAARGIV